MTNKHSHTIEESTVYWTKDKEGGKQRCRTCQCGENFHTFQAEGQAEAITAGRQNWSTLSDEEKQVKINAHNLVIDEMKNKMVGIKQLIKETKKKIKGLEK